MKARVIVRPRPEILDPQGKAIQAALGRLGFEQIQEIRAGKSFELELTPGPAAEVEAAVRQMCDRLLVNPLLETYEIQLLDGGATP